jgi:hypothetical protein
MIGEFGELIDEAPYLLEQLIDGFADEAAGVVRLEVCFCPCRSVSRLQLLSRYECMCVCVHRFPAPLQCDAVADRNDEVVLQATSRGAKDAWPPAAKVPR